MDVGTGWMTTGRVFGTAVALAVAVGMAYFGWRTVRRMLQDRVSGPIGQGLAVFAALVLGTAGLTSAAGEFRQIGKGDFFYLVQGILDGLCNTLAAGFLPRQYGPIEFLTMVGFGAYGIHWLATRFAPRYTPPAPAGAGVPAPTPPAA